MGLGRPGGDVKSGKVAELFVFDNLGRTVRAGNCLEARMYAAMYVAMPPCCSWTFLLISCGFFGVLGLFFFFL